MTNLRKTKFYIDGGKSYEGYTADATWNGWQCPLFTKEVALQMAADKNESEAMEMYYNEQLDKFVVIFDESSALNEVEHYKGELYNFNGDVIMLYAIGAFSWCWDEDVNQVILALKDMSEAASRLTQAFEADEEMLELLNDKLNKYYPFKMDFVDIVYQINNWYEAFDLYDQGKTVEEIDESL